MVVSPPTSSVKVLLECVPVPEACLLITPSDSKSPKAKIILFTPPLTPTRNGACANKGTVKFTVLRALTTFELLTSTPVPETIGGKTLLADLLVLKMILPM